jgi:hypothetical protein
MLLQNSLRFVSLKRTFLDRKNTFIRRRILSLSVWVSLMGKKANVEWVGNAKRPCVKESLRCPLRAFMLTNLPSSAILLWNRSYVISVASDATQIRKFRNILNFFNVGKHRFTASVIKLDTEPVTRYCTSHNTVSLWIIVVILTQPDIFMSLCRLSFGIACQQLWNISYSSSYSSMALQPNFDLGLCDPPPLSISILCRPTPIPAFHMIYMILHYITWYLLTAIEFLPGDSGR